MVNLGFFNLLLVHGQKWSDRQVQLNFDNRKCNREKKLVSICQNYKINIFPLYFLLLKKLSVDFLKNAFMKKCFSVITEVLLCAANKITVIMNSKFSDFLVPFGYLTT